MRDASRACLAACLLVAVPAPAHGRPLQATPSPHLSASAGSRAGVVPPVVAATHRGAPAPRAPLPERGQRGPGHAVLSP